MRSLIAYLGLLAFPNRRIAWGWGGWSGERLSGGDREAFGWPSDRALPNGVSMVPLEIESPGVLRRVSLSGEVATADIHLVPDAEGLWCFVVESEGETAATDGGRDLEKQDILLHTIVHDLASPLSGIVGCLNAIEDGVREPSDLERLVALGLRQAHLQERLIRQILDVFRADNEDLGELEASPPDLGAAARSVVESLEPNFRLHGVQLRLEDFRSIDKPVVGEQTRLERILANLLDNGLRFAPEGSEVVVRLEEHSHGVEVAVLDRGPGVPESRRGELFQKLRQGNNRGKLGLGLYFCRITVQRWGGYIGYTPRKNGGGACFWFRLPWRIYPR
ncbi:MAG: HAMP domain-containing histidine kinase [Myxococcales bacterium]|nr:HAMP domain-containing histidine kinase [Myxococcales bacterium]